MHMPEFIYALIDPNTDDVRYVGRSQTPKLRLQAHLRSGNKNVTERERWLHSLKLQNQSPKMVILQQCTSSYHAKQVEAQWIEHYWNRGASLTNIVNPSGTQCIPRSKWNENRDAINNHLKIGSAS